MRIAYLTHQFLPRHIGGVEIYTYGLARRAQQQGKSVCVITYHESPSAHVDDYGRQYVNYQSIPVTEIHYNLSMAETPAYAEYHNPFTAQEVHAELVKFRPSVVHVMHAMKLSGSVLESCFQLGLPVVVTLADFWFFCPRHTLLKWNDALCTGPKHALYCAKCLYHTHGFADSPLQQHTEWILWLRMALGLLFHMKDNDRFWREVQAMMGRKRYLKRILCRADRVIALSHFQKQMFVKNGYPAHKIQVINAGIETQGMEFQVGELPAILTLIYIGSLVPHKGLHILLEALSQCPDLKLKLLIYGDTTRASSYLEKVMDMSRADSRIEWRGTFPIEEQGQVLQQGSVLAMPALWYENDPLVVKAALYLGIPVMASKIGSLEEMIKVPDAGWLIPPGDVRAWATALRELATHNFSHRQPHPIESMDTHTQEIFEIYDEVSSQ